GHQGRGGRDARVPFSPQTSRDTLTYYWAKKNKQTHDNVAIGNVPLDTNYNGSEKDKSAVWCL
ncbi:hypothetical protein NQ315_004527, partial [Exocentrus adspersus]